MSESVTAALTSATSSAGCMMKQGVARVSGTFVASWQVEIDAMANGTWAPALDSTGAALTMTVPGVFRVDNGVACPTRVTCTAYTSGTLNVALRD